MPLVSSVYNPPIFFKNGHVATLYAGLLRKVEIPVQKRERITLPDTDFMDLDWSFSTEKTKKVAIILHGLEGNAQRPYIVGSAKQFNMAGYDVCAINHRSCSGEPNKLYRSYHSGVSEDLDAVVKHILEKDRYSEIVLQGFSLGGNVVLKYLGEYVVPSEIKKAVAVSVPCSLHNSLVELLKPKNFIYSSNFKMHLVNKLKVKQQQFPDKISKDDIKKVKTLKDFDDVYTSKANGFVDAMDYYEKCSSLQFLPSIKTPTLIVNAKNDSFLGDACYPIEEAKLNHNLFLEMPQTGGHVGFFNPGNITYVEKRTIKFLED